MPMLGKNFVTPPDITSAKSRESDLRLPMKSSEP